jgi:ribonuclease D
VTYQLIADQQAFDALLDAIADEPIVALDTEAASFHRYHDRVYLVQLSTRDRTAVIDPLAVADLGRFGALLADPKVEKIFHDADYDLRLLHHQYGFTPTRLFDTRVAAQLLGEPGIGLAALLEHYLGIRPDKRFQRADWSVRPLSDGMLDYAAGDTMHLCELRDILLNKLVEKGRLAWAEEEFALIESARWTRGDVDPREAFLSLKGARPLERRALAILRELYAWREETASQLDRAGFRVMGNDVLLQLAQHPVETLEQLAAVRGVGREIAGRRGGEVLAAIRRGLAVPEAELPRFPRGPRRPPPDEALEARLQALKLRRNQLAEGLGLQPGVLCPNGTLEAIARLNPTAVEAMAEIEEMRQWQREVIGADLLAALPAGGTG